MNAVGSWHRLCLAESVQPLGTFLLGRSVWKLFSLAALTIPDVRVRWEHFPERFLGAPWSYGEHSSLQERPILGMFSGACRECRVCGE